jgi:hypothetical protein
MKIAIAQRTIPVTAGTFESLFMAAPTILIIKPTKARGILNQLNHPKKGIKPTKNPTMDIIPKTSPTIPII